MNKTVKGSLAGAAGVALLMGGFGSYALWSDSDTMGSGSVQSGKLDITNVGAAQWADISTNKTAAAWTAGDYMVPGDKVTLTRSITTAAIGKNLQVDFTLSGLPTSAGQGWDHLVVTGNYAGSALTGTVNDNGTPANTADDTLVFTHNYTDPSAIDGAHDLVLTFQFNDVNGLTEQNKSVSLAGLGLSIAQHRPS